MSNTGCGTNSKKKKKVQVWVGFQLKVTQLLLPLSDDSVSMPSVVSEQEAYLLSTIGGRRRFSSHVSSMSAPQAEVGLLPSQR